MFDQRSKELGLPSGAFVFPSVKVMADRSVYSSSALVSPHAFLDAAQARKAHLRSATLILWVLALALDIGSLCGLAYLSWAPKNLGV